jgi:hypothetical protein
MTDDKTRCESDSHEQHLCWMATQAVRSPASARRSLVEEQQALARDPRFRCDWCGRVAASDRNLCKPVSLSDNERCESAAHAQHLCHMVAQAMLRNEPLVYHGGWPIPQGREHLAWDPRFRCRTCGRKAKSDQNLCEPTGISPP